ncbi:hypothetical protein JHK84_039387 [Glycine max]|nr:hypothetical protein JHK84_039387 [Glycine max]
MDFHSINHLSPFGFRVFARRGREYTDQDMPQGKLDWLLKEYGLPTGDDLAYKREFAMGAFL